MKLKVIKEDVGELLNGLESSTQLAKLSNVPNFNLVARGPGKSKSNYTLM